MELETIMRSATSQAEKDKYHTISAIRGTQWTKQMNEQNRTRGREMRTRGEGEPYKGEKKGKGLVKEYV